MYNEKSYFWTQNGSLVTCHIGVVMIEYFEHAQGSYNMAAPLSTGTV